MIKFDDDLLAEHLSWGLTNDEDAILIPSFRASSRRDHNQLRQVGQTGQAA